MSRMDKYKKIHEESQKEEKKPFGFRREMKKEKQTEKRDFEDINYEKVEESHQEPEEEFYYEDHYQESKKKRPNIKLPRLYK